MPVLNPNSRSISLPPRPNPFSSEFDEHLSRLSSSKFPSTSSSIADRLSDLKDLYDCVDGLLMLPHNQTTLFRDCRIDSVLDGSLRLLDICSIARDGLISIKEQVQGIQSTLRRRCSGELSFNDEMSEYVGSIKGVKKVIKKCLEDFPKGCCRIRVCEGSNEKVEMGRVLREVEGVTYEIFRSLLCYMVGVDVKSRKGSWSLVSKILLTMACEVDEAVPRNEFDDVDAVIGLCFERKRNGIDVLRAKSLTNKMVKLETVIQDFDELLECVFRRLVKTRANLLNILSL